MSNLILLLIDPDHEKVTISISILVVLLPFIYICFDFLKSLINDFTKDTKYLYLSADNTINEIFCSRLLTTIAYSLGYVFVLSIFQQVNILQSSIFIISSGFSFIGLLSHAIIGLVVYKKSISF